ncbi:hypothetical protein [Allosphingosinicella humi]
MTPLDPDRTLALAYVPHRTRPAVEALWRLDAALGAVLAGGRERLISQIKLVWWRDSLEKLDRERAPAEPVLQAVATYLLPTGISGADLAEMEAPWSVLLDEHALESEQLEAYAARGRLLFRLSARLMSPTADFPTEEAGALWALADLARHSGEPDATAAREAARGHRIDRRWPSALRPLGMLACLAARDAARDGAPEPQGSPARMLRMLRHRLTGR